MPPAAAAAAPQLHPMRRASEFMVWNHVFMAYETYRASRVDGVLRCMALPCTLLSVVRHVHHEKCCNTTEPLLAKATMLYLAWASTWLETAQMAALMASKALIVAVWLAADAHYYLDCAARHPPPSILGAIG